MKTDPFTDVKKYRSSIHNELAKYHLENYTTVLVALMQQESHGKGGDPMQASESAGLPRNTINDPSQSIQLGVKHFQRVHCIWSTKKCRFCHDYSRLTIWEKDILTTFAQHGGKHSEELAQNFSLLQVQKAPNLYTLWW